ncbi:MAG: phosphoribosylglycinamide formyltransferase [Treponema sp. CETP13]|nr:MAG: phosphoribosylglycinamide formyltransferase [Treponema sp. CETP13]
MNIAVLVSGGGTNLQALIDNEKKQGTNCAYHIVCVLSDRKSAFALERAKKANIPTEIVSSYSILGKASAKILTTNQKRIVISQRCLEHCKTYKADAIVLAGFLTVLSGSIIQEYSNRIINLHPALLPKFGGEGMWGENVHKAVIAAGEKESGCTIHLVDDGCDTGRILLQKKVPVLSNDTPKTLYERIAPVEHEAMVEGVVLLAKEFDS